VGQPGLATHDFQGQLAFSEKASDEPFWDKVYRKAFPSMVNHMLASGDVKSQRMGIDRVVLLSSGKTLYIDEKKRKEVYDDILLEHISVDTTGSPGWMDKDLAIDYLAYAFMPTRKVYLFPWDMLRRAWLHYRREWIGKYPEIIANNGSYKTVSVAVPIGVLRSAVSNATVIEA